MSCWSRNSVVGMTTLRVEVLEIGLFSLFPCLQAFQIGSGAHLDVCLMDIMVCAISSG